MKLGRELSSVRRFDMFLHNGTYHVPEAGELIASEDSGATYLIDHAERTFGTVRTVAGLGEDGHYYRRDDQGRRFYRFNLRLIRVTDVDEDAIDWTFARYPRDKS